jgi:hypothetical protein
LFKLHFSGHELAGKENSIRPSSLALGSKFQTSSLQNPTSINSLAQKRERQTTTTIVTSEKRTFTSKFDIYDDSANQASQDIKRSPDRNVVTSLTQKTSWRDQVFRRTNPIIPVIPIADRIQNSNIQPSKIRTSVNPLNRVDRVDRIDSVKSPTSSSSTCQPVRGEGLNDLEKLRSTFGRVNIQDRIASISGNAILQN